MTGERIITFTTDGLGTSNVIQDGRLFGTTSRTCLSSSSSSVQLIKSALTDTAID